MRGPMGGAHVALTRVCAPPWSHITRRPARVWQGLPRGGLPPTEVLTVSVVGASGFHLQLAIYIRGRMQVVRMYTPTAQSGAGVV